MISHTPLNRYIVCIVVRTHTHTHTHPHTHTHTHMHACTHTHTHTVTVTGSKKGSCEAQGSDGNRQQASGGEAEEEEAEQEVFRTGREQRDHSFGNCMNHYLTIQQGGISVRLCIIVYSVHKLLVVCRFNYTCMPSIYTHARQMWSLYMYCNEMTDAKLVVFEFPGHTSVDPCHQPFACACSWYLCYWRGEFGCKYNYNYSENLHVWSDDFYWEPFTNQRRTCVMVSA